MAPSRRARIEEQQQYEGDTDIESEQETPRHQKSHLKKRLSEAYFPDADGSLNSDNSRMPLKSVNLNDDAAEKRRRRKSAKLTVIDDLALSEPSGDAGTNQENGEPSRSARPKQQINTVAPPAEMNVPLDVMSSNFEEWMKMATDNKINATNSWNFALIDYFHDMSLLRNNDDNSINFQRASCTLDGCVKIWTSRVDSVGTETGKLLSNLANEGNRDDEDENDSDNPDADPTQAKKKKAHRPAATLAKDPSVLRSKKLDLEFSVDPLFKKTCADFDEGGAQGLLMNHLSLGTGPDSLRIIFDASDSLRRMDEEEEKVDEPPSEVDLSHLRNAFLPDLAAIDEMEIAPSLGEFAFGKSALSSQPGAFLNYDDDDDDDDDDGVVGPTFDMEDGIGDAPVEDFFTGVDAINDDFGAGDMGGDDYAGDENSMRMAAEAGQGVATGPYVPFDPRMVQGPNGRDLTMAFTDTDNNGALDYFDKNYIKNWAGPEHWKLRKVIRKAPTETDTNVAKGKKKDKKEAFTIDFFKPAEKDLKVLSKELFAPVTRGQSINLPGTGAAAKKSKKKTVEKKNDHRLPDDIHFSSRQLVRLFLKPKFELKMRGRKVKINESGDGEVDANFWAQAAADQATGGGADDDEDGDANMPFNTQFFQDDYDDGPGFDDDGGYDGITADAGAEEQDLLAQTTNHTRRVRPEKVNYAKRAKRVDVRKLKDNIWKGLDIIVPHKTENEDSDEEMDVDEDKQLTDPSEARQFSQVINGLQQTYPKDKMEEISTSFCFICLLHLANEQGLKLESQVKDEDGLVMEDDEVIEQKVGNIWDIKIFRDPVATPAA